MDGHQLLIDENVAIEILNPHTTWVRLAGRAAYCLGCLMDEHLGLDTNHLQGTLALSASDPRPHGPSSDSDVLPF